MRNPFKAFAERRRTNRLDRGLAKIARQYGVPYETMRSERRRTKRLHRGLAKIERQYGLSSKRRRK